MGGGGPRVGRRPGGRAGARPDLRQRVRPRGDAFRGRRGCHGGDVDRLPRYGVPGLPRGRVCGRQARGYCWPHQRGDDGRLRPHRGPGPGDHPDPPPRAYRGARLPAGPRRPRSGERRRLPGRPRNLPRQPRRGLPRREARCLRCREAGRAPVRTGGSVRESPPKAHARKQTTEGGKTWLKE